MATPAKKPKKPKKPRKPRVEAEGVKAARAKAREREMLLADDVRHAAAKIRWEERIEKAVLHLARLLVHERERVGWSPNNPKEYSIREGNAEKKELTDRIWAILSEEKFGAKRPARKRAARRSKSGTTAGSAGREGSGERLTPDDSLKN